MLNNQELARLLHDLKRASKALKLIAVEPSKEKRDLLLSLISDELDRLYEDLEDLKEQNGNGGNNE